ncbi:cysteine desulfurase family protein [Seonamhaeicola marinus]|uniref:cysteine desulfurase n=1 Tax=Seonamhaeicola marinus TaxID=1912246 RepID=A0A5D0HNN6_9FLAO|nr:cysteine desulfurase family protein [Seonamhaeicola marinus]TYA71677.1 cysteine desulfurase [Seonamhaeicola marinus]
MKTVYFDNAATTRIREEVIASMAKVMQDSYGNPSSSHSFGRSSKTLVEKARKTIAGLFKVSASEIIFTSGGTEADNLVLKSAVRDLGITHIISSKIEHHAVLHTINQLQTEYGIIVNYVNVSSEGVIDYKQLEELLKANEKTLVSLMYINNEIGNILDVKQVGDLCKEHNALFHTDAVQAIGHYNIDLQNLNIDFFAASAHKFHGPKGVGFAFVRKDSGLKPLILGGEQERGLRAGTESVHNIVGTETALKMAYDNLEKESKYLEELKQYFIDSIRSQIPNVKFNGLSENLSKSSYTLINVCLPMPPEAVSMILFQLDLKGIACSRGSACQSGSTQVSHVLAEILNEEDLQKPSLRFSFSIYNTKDDVDYVVSVLKDMQ